VYTWVISFLFTYKMGCNQIMSSLRFGDSFTIYISTTDFFICLQKEIMRLLMPMATMVTLILKRRYHFCNLPGVKEAMPKLSNVLRSMFYLLARKHAVISVE